MDKIKKFIDCGIPTDACNFKCHYCYIGQKHNFSNKVSEFARTPAEVRKALSYDRLGGSCLINFCATGETLLSYNLLMVIKELLEEGHYVMIVTNGSLTARFKTIATFSEDLRKKLFIKFSFHYLELKRLNLLDKYVENVNLMKEKGVSYTIETVPNDELVPYLNEMKAFCIDRFGALCHVSIARDERTQGFELLSQYNWEEYDKIWDTFDSEFFSFKRSTFDVKRKEFCYAGEWSFSVDLQTGEYRKCTYEDVLGNIYEDVDKPLKRCAVGKHCKMAHCYNSHAYLTLGNIPVLETPTYAKIRNRKCADGSEWLASNFKEIASQKLFENNSEYNKRERIVNELLFIKKSIKKHGKIVIRKIRGVCK